MGMNNEESRIIQTRPKGKPERNMVKSLFMTTENGRPNSMIVKRAHRVIPAHIIAEAISTLHGIDLRWSGPITPAEMQYVEQYVVAKYPEYSNALVEGKDKTDLYELCVKEEPSEPSLDDKRKSPRGVIRETSGSNFHDLVRIELEPSRLLDILTKKSSYLGSFISIPEIQARNKVLKHCGLPDNEYLVLFVSSYRDAMMLVGESYPFFRGNFYMTIINEEHDYIRAFADYTPFICLNPNASNSPVASTVLFSPADEPPEEPDDFFGVPLITLLWNNSHTPDSTMFSRSIERLNPKKP